MSNEVTTSQELKFNKLYATSLAKNLPLSGIMELTYDCNLRCKHCYIVKEDQSVLSKDEILGIIDQLADMGTLFLTFTGGEALLRPDFFDIADYARSRNFVLRIFTNGTFVDSIVADKIKKINPLAVGISVYSHRAEIHDLFTGVKGSFVKSIKAIELLVDRDIKVELKCNVLKINLNNLDDIVRMGEELGCSVKFDPMITPQNNGGKAPLEFAIDHDELVKFYMKMGPQLAEEVKNSVDRDESIAFCRAGRDVISISPFGDVFPCTALPVTAGNLKSDKLSEIWHSQWLQSFRKQSIIYNVKKCRVCDLLSVCNHCIGIDYVESGSLARPSEINCSTALAYMQSMKE